MNIKKFFGSTQNLFSKHSFGSVESNVSSSTSTTTKLSMESKRISPFQSHQCVNSDFQHEQHNYHSKVCKRTSILKKKPSILHGVKIDDFRERLREYCSDMFTEEYTSLVSQWYFLENNWTDLIRDDYMTMKMRKQQQGIWEFLTTERNYIRRMRVVCEVFWQVFRIAQRESDLSQINECEIFGSINEILITSDKIWKDNFVKVINETRATGRPIAPSKLFTAFHETDKLYKSYIDFNMKQDECLNRIREYSDPDNEYKRDDPRKNFKIYLEFCESLPQCERLKLVDLMTEPMQRMTRYPLLLKSIFDSTENTQEKKELQSMITKFDGFVFDINKRKREIFEKKKMDDCLGQFEYYNTWFAGNEEVMWVGVDFLRSDIVPNATSRAEPRCILKQEGMKLMEKKGKAELVVEVLLFTDALVLARRRNSTKKLVIVKQLFFLDKIRFIKSEISNTSIVFLYLDDHGLLAASFMLELNEKSRDEWITTFGKAKERYEKARCGRGSTLEFFQDENKAVTDDTFESSQNQILSSSNQISSSNGSTEVFRKTSTASKTSNNGKTSRKSSTASNKSIAIQDDSVELSPLSPHSHCSQEVVDLGYNDDLQCASVDRRSASWLLTEEKRVQSIRCLLREDLWGEKQIPEHSSSFRSQASDSGVSLNGDSFRSTKSDISPESFRKKSTSSLGSTIDTPNQERDSNIARKYSNSCSALPNISEQRVYTEMNFKRRDQVQHRKQRRSIRSYDADTTYTPMDENNNESLSTKGGANAVFGTLTRATPLREKTQHPVTNSIKNGGLNGEDNENTYDDVVLPYSPPPLPTKKKTDQKTQCRIVAEKSSISTQTNSPHQSYVNHEIIAHHYENYLQDG